MITENSVSSEEIVINAPAKVVWNVILDFDNYGLWNPFCPSMKGEAVIGSPLEMQVDLGNGLQPQVEYVTKIEPFHTVVWSMENKPGDPIHADRVQRIVAIVGFHRIFDADAIERLNNNFSHRARIVGH